MNDEQIVKTCFIISLIGILLLFVYTELLKPDPIKIGDIDDSTLGKNVVIEGIVKNIDIIDGNVFIEITDGNKIDAIVFERTASRYPMVYDVMENTPIRIVGKVENYKGALEVVVESIEGIS
ncbi:MAG: hypothetical protein HZB67_02180 [Candidatus Aenigmarchaeota archaeon]|nr:hypothetical protein [Candidatus Aenigmarchaeota archaeon]